MVFRTENHLSRAKGHLESRDPTRLPYAALELRFALEQIAYKKLQQRLDKITLDEIAAWQPRQAMERLLELVDEHLNEDVTLRMTREDGEKEKEDREWATVGSSKGIHPKDIGKHWQKLSSYLHVRMPKHKQQIEYNQDYPELESYISKVIAYIENITSTKFDVFFSENVIFTCFDCKKKIIRNAKLLKDGDIVRCQNQDCSSSYVARVDNGNYRIKRNVIEFHCPACHHASYVDGNFLLPQRRHFPLEIRCGECRADFKVKWQPMFEPITKSAQPKRT